MKRAILLLLTALGILLAVNAIIADTPLPGNEAIKKLLATRVDVERRSVGIVVGIVTPAERRVVSHGAATLEGWAVDFDVPNTPVEIHVYRGGPFGVGTFFTSFIASRPRPDLTIACGIHGNNGFNINIGQLSERYATVCVRHRSRTGKRR